MLNNNLKKKLNSYKNYYDKNAKQRPNFRINQKVIFKNNNKWEKGVIKQMSKSPRSYVVTSERNREYRRNKHHMKRYLEPEWLTNKNDSQRSEVETNVDSNYSDGNKHDHKLRSGKIFKQS